MRARAPLNSATKTNSDLTRLVGSGLAIFRFRLPRPIFYRDGGTWCHVRFFVGVVVCGAGRCKESARRPGPGNSNVAAGGGGRALGMLWRP